MRYILISLLAFFAISCLGSPKVDYWKTVDYVDIERFMGKWYVITSRATSFEEGAHNAIETYTWNEKKNRIDIAFDYLKDGFDGKKKSMPQKATIENTETNAHWKVNPFLWFKFDYLVIGLADDYSWTVIGVPDQKYVWIMAKDYDMSDEKLKEIVDKMAATGYDMSGMVAIPHKY